MMPYLAKILLYPVKSLNGVEVENARVLASGALQHDREFAIFDEQGKFVNGKRHAKIHLLRAQFALLNRTISLQIPGDDLQQIFHLDEERQALEATLSDFFKFAVTLGQCVSRTYVKYKFLYKYRGFETGKSRHQQLKIKFRVWC